MYLHIGSASATTHRTCFFQVHDDVHDVDHDDEDDDDDDDHDDDDDDDEDDDDGGGDDVGFGSMYGMIRFKKKSKKNLKIYIFSSLRCISGIPFFDPDDEPTRIHDIHISSCIPNRPIGWSSQPTDQDT